MKKDEISRIMKDWDRNLNPAYADTTQLKNRIMDGIESSHARRFYSDQYIHIRKGTFYFACAASFLLLASAVLLRYLSTAPTPHAGAAQTASMISEEDLKEARELSGAVEKLFSNKVQWIVRSGDKLEIMPSESPAGLSKPKILIRQTVLRKSNDGWRKVFVADIIAGSGERVDFSSNGAEGAVWAYQAENGVFATDGSMTIKIGGENICLNYSQGQRDGESVILKNIKNPDSELMVCQTVVKI